MFYPISVINSFKFLLSNNANTDNFKFLDPYLLPQETSILYKYLNKSHVLFEFRSGGVTQQAAKRGLKIYSVEIGESWLKLLTNDIHKINKFMGKEVDITYLLVDLHSKNQNYQEFKKYVKIYVHSKYRADIIYIDGEYQFSILMNIYNQIDNDVIVIIHELNNDFLSTIQNYYDVVEFAVRTYVLKKTKHDRLSDSLICDFEQKDFTVKNQKTWFFDFIKNNYYDIIEKYKFYYNDDMIKPAKKQVWFFWWQNIERAPDAVKLCLASIKKNFDGEVFVISQNNFLEYTSIPSYVIEKVNNQSISFTHFADVYRMKLLAERGGLWIDATMLVTKTIPSSIFDYPYFSIRFYHDMNFIFGKWCTFIQASSINNIVTKFVSEILLAHMKKYNKFIHFFYLDFIILFGYDYLPQFHRDIQLIPFNNLEVFNLMSYISDEYSENKLKPLINSETYFYKMTWKMQFHSSIDGKLTIFGYLMHKYLT